MYRAKETFWAPDNRRIVKGDLVAEHDPVVTGREGLFEAVVIPRAVPPADAPARAEPSGSAADSSTSEETGSQPPTQAPPPAAKKTAAKKTTAAPAKRGAEGAGKEAGA